MISLFYFFSGDLGKPLFLHCRGDGAVEDLLSILRSHFSESSCHPKFVVHSFDGTVADLNQILSHSPADASFVSVNGCSLRPVHGRETIAGIPLDKLLLETDAPWCSIRSTHPAFPAIVTKFKTTKPEKHALSLKKTENATVEPEIVGVDARCEPAHIVQVLEAVSAWKELDKESVASQVYKNSLRFLNWNDN